MDEAPGLHNATDAIKLKTDNTKPEPDPVDSRNYIRMTFCLFSLANQNQNI